MPPLYMLKLNRSSDPRRPQESYYAQGMSAQCISLENVIHWTIVKIEFPLGSPQTRSLNRGFLCFQRKVRDYLRLLRRVRNIRNLFRRELGLPP
jgi:hypothetical protein